jgi:hypothetical protein
VVWVRERTIPTERPPLVGEVSANFCGYFVCIRLLVLLSILSHYFHNLSIDQPVLLYGPNWYGNISLFSISKWHTAQLNLNEHDEIFELSKRKESALCLMYRNFIIDQAILCEATQWNITQQGVILLVPSARLKSNSTQRLPSLWTELLTSELSNRNIINSLVQLLRLSTQNRNNNKQKVVCGPSVQNQACMQTTYLD